jgi:hypothetical protein
MVATELHCRLSWTPAAATLIRNQSLERSLATLRGTRTSGRPLPSMAAILLGRPVTGSSPQVPSFERLAGHPHQLPSN